MGIIINALGSIYELLTNKEVGATATDSTTLYPSSHTVFTEMATKQPLTPRVQSVASAATVTPTATNDEVVVTALAAACQFLNPTGSPVQGQAILIRIKDDATPRALTYDTQYRAVGITLPTTTTASKTTYIGAIYNSTDTKWDCISTVGEA